jgi:methylated-DNA-[protein]-cysteine S-methyltransferase
MVRGMSTSESCYLNTPVGWLRISADASGLTEISFIEDPPKTPQPVHLPHLKEAYRQLSEYFRGERMSFNLPLNPRGTDFQRSVWRTLTQVPFGTTISYKALAQEVGCPGGARAVGQANNRNPLPIVVPCHRVIGADGELAGYALGPEVKRTLLRIEGAEFA